jgi:beta-phosphoglucomutase
MVKALLFDLDGTLIDSEQFHLDCWNQILIEAGIRLDMDDWIANYSGVPMPANAKRLIEKYGLPVAHDELVRERESVTLNRLQTVDINLMPFANETLEFFKEKGLTLALVTGSASPDVDAIFKRNGMNKYFDLIITRSDVAESKPHPESYELCCRKLGLSPNECIAFEDTVNGVKSAKAASLVCYAIQARACEHLKLDAADKIFSDFNAAKKYLLANNLL